jgi:molybdopterin-biosynthesis enzyme MoeA-like protein
MAWPMIEWVLDNKYANLFNREPHLEQSVLVYEAAESSLTPLMVALEKQYPRVKVFSLPSVGDANTRRHIELGVKGEPAQTLAAFQQLREPRFLYRFECLRAEGFPVVEPHHKDGAVRQVHHRARAE